MTALINLDESKVIEVGGKRYFTMTGTTKYIYCDSCGGISPGLPKVTDNATGKHYCYECGVQLGMIQENPAYVINEIVQKHNISNDAATLLYKNGFRPYVNRKNGTEREVRSRASHEKVTEAIHTQQGSGYQDITIAPKKLRKPRVCSEERKTQLREMLSYGNLLMKKGYTRQVAMKLAGEYMKAKKTKTQ